MNKFVIGQYDCGWYLYKNDADYDYSVSLECGGRIEDAEIFNTKEEAENAIKNIDEKVIKNFFGDRSDLKVLEIKQVTVWALA